MSIEIREYSGYEHSGVKQGGVIDFAEAVHCAMDTVAPGSLMAEIEGIHAGPTRNFNRYMDKALKDSVDSWTKPYRRPLIKHHNEENGATIGRICAVEYVTKGTRSGTPALRFTVNVPDKEAMQEMQDGRLDTVSIGVIGLDVRCSICGHSISKHGPCEEHDKGSVYGGQICYWDIYKFEAKELSYVVVPSDPYTKTLKVYFLDNQKTSAIPLAANLEGDNDMNLQEQLDAAIAEKTQLVESQTAAAAQLTEAQTKITELEAQLAEKDVAITESAAKITELTAAVETTTVALTEAAEAHEAALAAEVSLREAAEASMEEISTKSKANLAETVNLLRKAAGEEPIQEADLSGRSTDSLNDSVKDLVESLKKTQLPNLVGNPTLVEKNEDTNVEKTKTASNINLEEGLLSLFDGVVKARG